MVVNYLRTDSLNMDYIATDTLNFFMRRSRQERRQAERAAKEAEKEAAKAAKEKEQAEEAVQEEKSESAEDEAMGKEGESEGGDKAEPEKEQPTFLAIQSNIQGSFELYNPIRIEFEHPVIVFDSTHVELSIEVDSLYETVPFRLETDSLNPRKFVVRTRWEPGAKYKFRVDSATIFNYYGLWNDTYEQSFTVKALDQYGNLEITLSGLQPDKEAFVELLDKSGKPFRKSSVKSNVLASKTSRPVRCTLALSLTTTAMGYGQPGITRSSGNLKRSTTTRACSRLGNTQIIARVGISAPSRSSNRSHWR